ncbi:MAG TPA: TIM barrel protein [Vicinamibacterales bacterium]|jgi:hydroxypyruvate isomerase|nr:TIM barrel protein [Vicinamibacterales bacterium]
MAKMSRRKALQWSGGAALGTAFMGAAPAIAAQGSAAGSASAAQPEMKVVKRGRLKQSVCRWNYAKIPLEDLCAAIAGMGLTAIDLLQPDEWPVAKAHGLTCSMAYAGGGSIPDAFNNPANHDKLVQDLSAGIPKAAAAGIPNVITFFGNHQPGMSDADAMQNCVTGLNRIKKVAEDHNVTVCVELLNSLVNHKGYQGDHTAFGVEVVKAVDSPRVKLLYDIYHMQIMEGNVIDTIRKNIQYIAHFHTGGVPGRHELDDSQELNWRAIALAIVATGFDGYMAHEFTPVRDPLTSLREAVSLCDI